MMRVHLFRAAGPPALGMADMELERRLKERRRLGAAEVPMLVRGIRCALRVKDLSSKGLCGLTDAPLAAGETVFFLFPEIDPVAAEIRWVRRAFVGAAFSELLPAKLIQRMVRRDRH